MTNSDFKYCFVVCRQIKQKINKKFLSRIKVYINNDKYLLYYTIKIEVNKNNKAVLTIIV